MNRRRFYLCANISYFHQTSNGISIKWMRGGDVSSTFSTPSSHFAKMPNAARQAQSQTARRTDSRLRNEFIAIFHLIKAGERVMQVRAWLEIASAGWLSVFNMSWCCTYLKWEEKKIVKQFCWAMFIHTMPTPAVYAHSSTDRLESDGRVLPRLNESSRQKEKEGKIMVMR